MSSYASGRRRESCLQRRLSEVKTMGHDARRRMTTLPCARAEVIVRSLRTIS